MHTEHGPLHVVWSTDRNYLPICATSIVSVLDNNKDVSEIHVHILHTGWQGRESEKFLSLKSAFPSAEFHFYPMDDLIRNYTIKTSGFSIGTYLRLLIGSVLPSHINKVLYLDGDILCVGSFWELWQTDMTGKICAGVLDAVTTDAKTRIGLSENDSYFNAGVLLINLEEWRKRNIEEKLIAFLNEHHGNVFHHDQGLINAVMHAESGWVSVLPKFDMMSVYTFMDNAQLSKLYSNFQIPSQQAIDDGRKNPVFYHDKFWAKYWLHPAKRKWHAYEKTQPFGVPIDRVKRSQKINNWLMRLCPFPVYWRLWQWQWKRKIAKKGQI